MIFYLGVNFTVHLKFKNIFLYKLYLLYFHEKYDNASLNAFICLVGGLIIVIQWNKHTVLRTTVLGAKNLAIMY